MTTTIQVLGKTQRTAPFHVKTKTMMIGSLTSNQISLEGAGVEPIHAMLEPDDGGTWRLTDLGTLAGLKVNGTKVEIETTVKAGDVIEVGQASFTVKAHREPERRVVPTLFGTRVHNAQKREGRTLEVIAYWGNTVLNVDHFAPDLKGFDEVTIGDPTKAHFISGGREFFDSRVLAEVEDQRCVLKLEDDMEARVRKNGEMQKLEGNKRLSLGTRDYAHVRHGAVRYFLHYANHPQVELPVDKRQDKVLQALGALGFVGYFVMVMIALLVKPKPLPTLPEVPTGPTEIYEKHQKVITLEPVQKKKDIVVKVPDAVKPVPPTQKKKIVKEVPPPVKEPVKQPTPKVPVQIAQQTVAQTQPANTKQPTPTVTAKTTPETPANPLQPTPTPSFKPGGGGQPAGQKMPTPLLGSNGGPGSKQVNMGQLKGQTAFNKPGVEGATGPQASTQNLGKLGNQFGKVSTLLGGTHVDFKSSPGGAGAKLGSATKDLGPGGTGGKSMDYAGNNNLKGWGKGPGSGGLLSGGPGNEPGFGPDGTGKGKGPGKGDGTLPGFGGHRQVSIPEQMPSLIGPATYDVNEILKVIRANLNQIRHCYEQALQRKPNLSGRIKTVFTIDSSGRVQTVTVADSTIDDMVMRGCVTGKIQRWSFPKLPLKEPVQVGYPFLFNPL